ncbi:MAG: hypothetical protein RQ760_07235 [Sedimentisphaerales bacterium]|nr:hypothetical protein [Sedimentisphaerales bacterium]
MTRVEIAETVLDYLKVLLSPQMIAGIIAVVFLWVFRDALKALMLRIARIRLPGGSEIFTSQAERVKEETSSRKEKPPPPPEAPKFDPNNLTITLEEMNQLKAVFDAERARAAFWEYEYLNLFLVPNTQKVLEWLSKLQQPATCSLFDNLWSPLIPNAPERRAILGALENHYLIILKAGDLIDVTPKGHEYLQVRRPRTEQYV